MSLLKINLDYSSLTFEEALRIEPGNKKIINNYLLSLLVSKQFAKFTKILSSVRKLLSDDEFSKYKALYHKFMKVSGIHQLEIAQRIADKGTPSPNKPGIPLEKTELIQYDENDQFPEEEREMREAP
jgi:hypothetical protein